MEQRANPSWRLRLVNDLLPMILVGLILRILFLHLVSLKAISMDFISWIQVGQEIEAGRNPYRTTSYLPWPPFWLVCVAFFQALSTQLEISIVRVIQVFLMLTEVLVLIAAYVSASVHLPAKQIKKVLWVGIVLNPICVFQVCQHGNFDYVVGLLVVLFFFSRRVFRKVVIRGTGYLPACFWGWGFW